MEINKLNKTFVSEQVLTANEMNQLSQKIDELVDGINTNTANIPDVSAFITGEQADVKYATQEQIGDIETILDNIIGG